jgi:hypothetical protein
VKLAIAGHHKMQILALGFFLQGSINHRRYQWWAGGFCADPLKHWVVVET